MRQYKSSKELETEMKERGISFHPRSTCKPTVKQEKLLAMARAREAVAAGQGTKAKYKGQEGHVVGCWFVYDTGYVTFLSDGKKRESIYDESYVRRVMDWNGCSYNKAIHLLENGYRLPKRKQ